MARLRVKRGCIPCRFRRKKCPEQKPVCGSCLRLGLKCSYQLSSGHPAYSHRIIVLGIYQLPSPLLQTQQLPITTFASAHAETVVARAPALLQNLFLPTYAYGQQCTTELIQIALSFDYVCDALVVCFTSIEIALQRSSMPLPQEMWQQASKSIRAVSYIGAKEPQLFLTLAIAAMFMGAIESLGTGFVDNLNVHHNAGTAMIQALQEIPHFIWSSIPRNLCILVLETFLFQATLCMFVSESELRISQLRFEMIHQVLSQMNPHTDSRIDKSPFYAGFYNLYALLYEIILLHRSLYSAEVSQARVDFLEKQILQNQSEVTYTVSKRQNVSTTELTKISETYNFFCAALLICVNALKAPSATRDSRIAAAIQIGLKIFYEIGVDTGNNCTLLWPIQVLRCAISWPVDLEAFESRFAEVRVCFYGAPLVRAERLFQRVSQISQQQLSVIEQRLWRSLDDTTIPRGMLLFRQRGGVLAQEL